LWLDFGGSVGASYMGQAMKYKIKPTKKSINELVKAGKYDYANSNINDNNFNLDTPAKELELFEIDGYKTPDEIIALMNEAGLEPATMTDLLHFGIQYPEEQRKNPIAALGSAWVDPDGGRLVGYLHGDADYRDCRLYWDRPGGRWRPHYVFAVRRRKSALSDLGTGRSEPLESLPKILTINGHEYERKV
jgi:hypothetical protein